MKALLGICMLLVMFMFAVYAPGTASAVDFNPKIHSASIGLTTAPMDIGNHSLEDFYTDLKFDVEVDARLLTNVFLLGDIGTDFRFQHAKSHLNDLNSFNHEKMAFRATIYAQPFSWLRTGPILRDGLIEYTVRIGLPF